MTLVIACLPRQFENVGPTKLPVINGSANVNVTPKMSKTKQAGSNVDVEFPSLNSDSVSVEQDCETLLSCVVMALCVFTDILKVSMFLFFRN